MKLHELLVTTCALLSIAWFGCDSLESDQGCSGCVVDTTQDGPLRAEAVRDIGDRADAAFDALGDRRSRFESRIGPQPWPRNLPENWPTPIDSLVLADANGREDGRLLLVDLSSSIDQSLDFYVTALRQGGFEVDQAGTSGRDNALRASRGSIEATLHFFARGDSTRLEILFIAE